MMRLLDAVLALPSLVVLVCLSSLVALDGASLVLLIGFVAWPSLARLVRGEAFALRGRDFRAGGGAVGGRETACGAVPCDAGDRGGCWW
ncbi:MAG: hypothetical protein WDN04_28315 [Rhodospirillales bacterium]